MRALSLAVMLCLILAAKAQAEILCKRRKR